jgi:hypothetical protein
MSTVASMPANGWRLAKPTFNLMPVPSDSNDAYNVRCWHSADITFRAEHVCCYG